LLFGEATMGLLGQIEAYLATHPQLIAAAGTPFVAWLAAKLLAGVLALFSLRRAHQITSPDDPALDAVEAIQRRRFPVEERDPEGVLTEKIAASGFRVFRKPRSSAVMIVLYYRRGKDITAYLTAEYFADLRTVFFWYIAMGDEDKPDGANSDASPGDPADAKAALRLVTKLLLICKRLGGWDNVIAEVDARDGREALKRLRRFQHYAWHLRHARFDNPLRPLLMVGRWLGIGNATQRPSVFKRDVPFRMPLHEAGLVEEAQAHETPAWLVVAPRDNEALAKAPGGFPTLRRESVAVLLEALRRSYTDPEEPAFNSYIARFFETMAAQLPEESRLLSQRADIGSLGHVQPSRPPPLAAE
jgi:hypothetical protein